MGTTDPQSAPIAPGIRASDADRERTAAALHTAASAGMLTLPRGGRTLTAAVRQPISPRTRISGAGPPPHRYATRTHISRRRHTR